MSICRYCGREFEPIRANQRDCSKRCTERLNGAWAMQRRGTTVYTKVCAKCGRNFMTPSESRDMCFECLPSPSGRHKDAETKKPKKKRVSAIEQVNKMARKRGISYGKFVAEQSMKPLERRKCDGLSEISAGKSH